MPDKNKLKIGLDLINLHSLHEGLARYAQQLIKGLAAMDCENEYVLFMNKETSNQIYVESPRFHKRIIRIPRQHYAPWNQLYFALYSLTRRSEVDLLHSLVTPSPLLLFNRVKTIVTLHDIAFKLFPEKYPKLGAFWSNIAWPLCLKQVTHVVADSERSKRDIVKFYNVPEEKITVIYPYILLRLPQISEEILITIKARYHLIEPYILHVSAPYKRKNIIALLEAFRILKKKKIPHKLVLVGPKGWAIQELYSAVRKLDLSKEVIFLGFVPEIDLPLIYKAADVFVFPSLYEGFGYPPLEAMACGTPVVVSGTSSLPEVVGDAGLFVDPLNPEDIAGKILKVISSPDLAERLRKAGLKRVQYFSKEKMINSYLQVYKKCAEQ